MKITINIPEDLVKLIQKFDKEKSIEQNLEFLLNLCLEGMKLGKKLEKKIPKKENEN